MKEKETKLHRARKVSKAKKQPQPWPSSKGNHKWKEDGVGAVGEERSPTDLGEY